MPSRDQLEAAAIDVVRVLKGISEFSNARIAVIGGLALWRYIPSGRTTNDVDFIINVGNAPQGVKAKLLALPKTPFVQQAQIFLYRNPSGVNIQIDITPEWQSPYMPPAATRLGDIQAGTVPYISATDLLIFKMNSCGLRAEVSKRRIDALDAQNLLERLTSNAPLVLTNVQRAIVEPCVKDVVQNGTKAKAWWRERLGLPASR